MAPGLKRFRTGAASYDAAVAGGTRNPLRLHCSCICSAGIAVHNGGVVMVSRARQATLRELRQHCANGAQKIREHTDSGSATQLPR